MISTVSRVSRTWRSKWCFLESFEYMQRVLILSLEAIRSDNSFLLEPPEHIVSTSPSVDYLLVGRKDTFSVEIATYSIPLCSRYANWALGWWARSTTAGFLCRTVRPASSFISIAKHESVSLSVFGRSSSLGIGNGSKWDLLDSRVARQDQDSMFRISRDPVQGIGRKTKMARL